MGYEKHEGCVEMSLEGLVEVYACQCLNNKSALKDGKELIEVSCVGLIYVKRGRLKQRLDCRDLFGSIVFTDISGIFDIVPVRVA